MKVKALLARIPFGAYVFLALVLGLVLWLYGTRIVNGVSRKVWHGQNLIITTEIQQDLDNADKAKEIAKRAIWELGEKKVELAKNEEALADEKQKREAAEKVLAERGKNTDQKLAAYEEALRHVPAVHVVPESTDELCAIALQAGIDCDAP